MSEVKVNKISPRIDCGTVQLGDSGDTITIPAGATITNNGTQTGFGRTGTVDWDTTAKTASFTAVSGNGYFVNTTSGAVTVTLPAGSAGDIVSLADYTNTWQTNNVTVTPNGSDKIGGINADATLTTEGQSVTFVYVDSTEGWKNVQDSTSNVTGNPNLVATGGTITTCGDYKIHTFTGPGTFTVSNVSQTADENVVSYLIIGGGGGGGGDIGGGGGAGGFREVKSPTSPYTASPLDGYPSAPNRITVTAQAYPIVVGGGGTGVGPGPFAPSGSVSSFDTITSAGGGGGGSRPGNVGQNGGSGGGAGGDSGSSGSGNTPPVSPPQGNGGGGQAPPGCSSGGGGGGGATTSGDQGNPTASGFPSGGNGGNGATTSITGSPVTRSGGGGGGAGSTAPSNSTGGPGGGGPGSGPNLSGGAGTANTGGGGGAGSNNTPRTGGNGGSGIVIIRYKYQ